MEIKKVESVVMTATELAKIVSYYVEDHYKKDIEFKYMDIDGERYGLPNDVEITFETE